MENRDQFTILETKEKCDSPASIKSEVLRSSLPYPTESSACCAPEQKVSFDYKESTSFTGSSSREMTSPSQDFASLPQDDVLPIPSSQNEVNLTPPSQEKYQTFSPTDYLKDKGPVGERPAFLSPQSEAPAHTPSASSYEDVKAGFRNISSSDKPGVEEFSKDLFEENTVQPSQSTQSSTPPLFKPNEASRPTVTTTPLFTKDAQSMKGERKSIWDTLVKRETPHLAHEATEYETPSTPKPEKSKAFTASPDEKVKWD